MKKRDPYLYEDVPVLKNLPGIKSNRELKLVESSRNRIILPVIYTREYETFNTETLCDIHRTIFAPLYQWAGELRTISIRKHEKALDGDTSHYAAPSEIRMRLDRISDEISQMQPTKSKPDILREIVHITAAIWQIHPFREGNTRSVVAFSILLAAKLGIKLDPALFANRAADVRNALVLCSRGSRCGYEDLERFYFHAAGLMNPAQESRLPR